MLRRIETAWKQLREFSYENRSFVETGFLLLYSIEQVVLVVLSYVIKNILNLSMAISIVTILVLTTFSLHKLAMESRIRILEDKVKSIHLEKTVLEGKYGMMQRKYQEKIQKYIK